jgi:hypothetical protein
MMDSDLRCAPSPSGGSLFTVEWLLDRGARWLVRGLVGLAVLWGVFLVLLSLPGPWGWLKLIWFGPLLVALWTRRSITRKEKTVQPRAIWTSVLKPLVASFGVVCIAILYGHHEASRLGFMMVMVPAVFFLAPAALTQSKIHARR